jgi:hypothetical protein
MRHKNQRNKVMTKFVHITGLMIAMSAVLIESQIRPVSATEVLAPGVIVAQRTINIETKIDAYADRIFFERHPELAGSKIRPGETSLAREWQEIRQCEAVVDYIFYERHPELAGRKIQRNETALVAEWRDIYDKVDGCQ